MFIAPNLVEAARGYLQSFSPKSAEKGAALFAQGAVSNLEVADEEIYFASVQGSLPYGVTLTIEDGKWFGECTCPVEVDCKHCYAAMSAMLEGAGPAIPPPAEETAGKPSARSTGDSASKKTFASIVEEKLGRKLEPTEKRPVSTVEDLYKNHGESARVAEYLLAPLLGGSRAWNYEMHELWPSPPRDAWEAWLYIVHFLRGRKKNPPSFLAEITPAEEVDAFVHEWQRRVAINHWNQQLGQFAARVESGGGGGLTDLRVIFAEIGARLEASVDGGASYELVKKTHYAKMVRDFGYGRLPLTAPAALIWSAFRTGGATDGVLHYHTRTSDAALNELLRTPLLADRMLGIRREPLRRSDERLTWKVDPATAETDDYRFTLVRADGTAPPPAFFAVDGQPSLYVTIDTIYEAPPLGGLKVAETNRVPAPALETNHGLTLLDAIGIEPPPRIAERTRSVRAKVVFRCRVEPLEFGEGEVLKVTIHADLGDVARPQVFENDDWHEDWSAPHAPPVLARIDRAALRATAPAVEALRLMWNPYSHAWERQVGKKFPGELADWLTTLPAGIEADLDPLLASLRDAPIAASVRLDVEEAGVDWFDLRVALDVADTTLTQDELKLLLDAGGAYVRLGAKGWRRLEFNLSEEDEQQLAELGLSAREFSSEPQRLHALQLAGKKGARLMPERHFAAIERRIEEIQMRVAPPVPATIQAELRPYQIEGFHFLAYLTTNRFGGILADDMGLGKTLQALAWLAWLPADKKAQPSLVVCPKSVMGNWSAEAAHFCPSLRVRLLSKGDCDASALTAARAGADIVVANYTQLRLLEAELIAAPWRAVILDEAQYIKNPESQTARIALALKAAHRLALSGTPIENRLLDLWSIMAFAMPGVLGNRAQFNRRFDQKNDPLARLRLSARVRPFLLRRTKNEVAKDLPDRIEEDLVCEMDGTQATLYRAELKRARQQLLKLKTARELDKARFNILTSLLRLRQICCHPALVSEKAADAESAKLGALMDLLEPLIEEGHKVLVFSQFVQMLALIRAEIAARGWKQFLLTGATEDRGPLVADFQKSEGAAVFLISLRAGGFGLNLTAASYVVLFDPWWNPAVENQAIDRTHRIGQTSKVIAYRLLVKDSIEEKIRHLQKQKKSLAADILGEESFARGLTMDDFQFLLAE